MFWSISFRKSTPPQNRQLVVYNFQLKTSWQFCGGVGFLKLIDKYMAWDQGVDWQRLSVQLLRADVEFHQRAAAGAKEEAASYMTRVAALQVLLTESVHKIVL